MNSKPSKKPLIVWDLDGTLVDSRADLAAAVNAARQFLGLDNLPVSEILQKVGNGLQRLLAESCPGHSEQALAQAELAFADYYAEHCCDQTTAFPQVLAAVQELHQARFQQAVVTNKPIRFTEIILARLGMRQYFATVIGGDKVKKPDPAGILSCMQISSRNPQQTTMVGDHHTDLLAGQAAGCATVFCAWGIGEQGDAPAGISCASEEDLLDWARKQIALHF